MDIKKNLKKIKKTSVNTVTNTLYLLSQGNQIN
jgi:uncharacterized protein (UPF0248 family)